jgi:four helix bundle protein
MRMGKRSYINRVEDLLVFQKGIEAAMQIFELSKGFPKEERFSLTDQARKSSRSVCACLSEAWGKRTYKAAFVAKLTDSEAEALETQTWIRFSALCRYIQKETAATLFSDYDEIISMLIAMRNNPDVWIL